MNDSNVMPTDFVLDMEKVIRDMASTVINSINVRAAHPTYGISKASIRSDLARMEGAIGLYMVLVGQSTHPSVYGIAVFADDQTSKRVDKARGMANVI